MRIVPIISRGTLHQRATQLRCSLVQPQGWCAPILILLHLPSLLAQELDLQKGRYTASCFCNCNNLC
jgi:hypothetical protein